MYDCPNFTIYDAIICGIEVLIIKSVNHNSGECLISRKVSKTQNTVISIILFQLIISMDTFADGADISVCNYFISVSKIVIHRYNIHRLI